MSPEKGKRGKVSAEIAGAPLHLRPGLCDHNVPLRRECRACDPNSPLTTLVPIEDVKRAASGHFFDPETMRFFSSRVARWAVEGPGGCFFTYSNRDRSGFGKLGHAHGGRRTHHVATFNRKTGGIRSLAGGYSLAMAADATKCARALAEGRATAPSANGEVLATWEAMNATLRGLKA